MSAQNSPMTRSAAAKLRAKRKSDGLDSEAADVSMTDAVADTSAVTEDSPATKRRKLPVRTKEVEEQPEEAAANEEEEDKEEDSDDEAPEAISTVQAAAATRKSAQKASQAADKRAAGEKRKRQEKDARLKAQAEARKAREEAAAEKAAEAVAAEAARIAEEEKEDEEAQTKAPVSKLLPLEFLDSDSEDEKPRKTKSTAMPTKPKKRLLKKKDPRDRQLGTTVYRLLTEGGPKTMAPKIVKKSRNVQQDMLVRNRVGKPVHSGFLRR
ncbi:hypothetical protein SEUCBS139899_001758 [Sporothrix eucalyptigena]|uniref:U3 snoRNA associated protein n=1 Tax=Sporothrix eucalyptigena TaxID=1812306 RepID=A0ABP0BWI1_9PEZI